MYTIPAIESPMTQENQPVQNITRLIPLRTSSVRDIMKVLLVIAMIVCLLSVPIIADNANMTFVSKSFDVASGGSTPYFFGTVTNNTSVMFYMPGKGEQRATLYWLNQIPLNQTVNVEYDNYVISDVKTSLVNGTWV